MSCRHSSHYLGLTSLPKLTAFSRMIPAVPALRANVSAGTNYWLQEVYGVPASADVLVTRRYKPVERHVRTVATTLPEECYVKRRFPEDPLKSLTLLTTRLAAVFEFGESLTKERWEALKAGEDGFLWEEEVRLAFETLKNNEEALVWTEAEECRFRDDYFERMVIQMIEHQPWAERNYPIRPGLFEQVVSIVKDKIASGVFEPSS
jgi:hypothetical protein